MPSSGLGAYQVKIHQVVFGGLFLLVVLMGVRGMAAGSVVNLQKLGALSIIAALVFALDKYYWLLCPFLMVIPFSIPGLPFDSGELGRLLFLGLFFARSAFRREGTRKFPSELFFAFPYFLWVALIYTINPSGMNILGSETIGSRFYFQIALGFLTLLTFSKLSISERDARYWVATLTTALILKFIMSALGLATLEIGEQGVRYFLIPAAPVLLLVLSHYDLRQNISISWRFPIMLFLAVAVAYSGSRTSLGQVLLAPFLIVFLRRREKGLLAVAAVMGAILIGAIVAGHGTFYELPYSAQRAMSFLPGKWDQKLEDYGMNDVFREQLQIRAREMIRESPWMGTKGYSIVREQIVWANSQGVGDSMYGGHVMAGNWHNKFYGMAADFGLPAAIAWYFFAALGAWYCIKNRWLFYKPSYRTTLFLYYSLTMFYDLVFAFGHSGLTPFVQWTYFGFVVALVRSAKADSEKQIRQMAPTADVLGDSLNVG